jgi:hypothetical protein
MPLDQATIGRHGKWTLKMHFVEESFLSIILNFNDSDIYSISKK